MTVPILPIFYIFFNTKKYLWIRASERSLSRSLNFEANSKKKKMRQLTHHPKKKEEEDLFLINV